MKRIYFKEGQKSRTSHLSPAEKRKRIERVNPNRWESPEDADSTLNKEFSPSDYFKRKYGSSWGRQDTLEDWHCPRFRTTLKEDLDNKEAEDSGKISKVKSIAESLKKKLSKVERPDGVDKPDPKNVLTLLKKVEDAGEGNTQIKAIFEMFVREYLKNVDKPHLVGEITKIMTTAYELNIKTGKTPKQACTIAIAIAIKALADNTLENSDPTNLNEVIHKSTKTSFWTYVLWFFTVILAVIVGGALVMYKYETMSFAQRSVFRFRAPNKWKGLIIHALFPMLNFIEAFIGLFTSASPFSGILSGF